MRAFRKTLLGAVVIAVAHLPRCSNPHKGESAWIDEKGELVVAPGYVMTTAGQCAALSNPALPPIPFEDVEHCFQKATPKP